MADPPDRTSPLIVFDLFHTLVDPEDFRPPDFERARRIAELLEVEPGRFEQAWRTWEPARTAGRIGVLELAEELTGRAIPPDLRETIDGLYGRYQDRALLEPRPEIVSTLRELADQAPLGLLSNAEARDVRCWDQSPLSTFFDRVSISCHTGSLKPDPRAYRSVLGQVEGSVSVFVGDGGSDELAGAKRFGFGEVVFMRGFVRQNGLRTPEELVEADSVADRTIDDLAELTDA